MGLCAICAVMREASRLPYVSGAIAGVRNMTLRGKCSCRRPLVHHSSILELTNESFRMKAEEDGLEKN